MEVLYVRRRTVRQAIIDARNRHSIRFPTGCEEEFRSILDWGWQRMGRHLSYAKTSSPESEIRRCLWQMKAA